MTDLAHKPDADQASIDDAAAPSVAAPVDGVHPVAPTVAWAPAGPAPRRRRRALWIGIPAGILAVALIGSSLVLIAPGTSVAGVPVGGLTPGAAADAIQDRLAETTVVLTGAGGDAEVTGADLGATVDARALADAAFADNPMWNPAAWFPAPIDAPVELDPVTAGAALQAAAADLHTDPVDATIVFDPASQSYVVTPAEPGTGIDVAAVGDALSAAFAAGERIVEFDAEVVAVEALRPTPVAEEAAAELNAILDTAGFYVGEERTVPLGRSVTADWLTVEATADGFEITANAAAIQPVVDTLPPLINREAENGVVITDSRGRVLREDAPGISGRELGDTSDVASDFAAQLAQGDGVFVLPVTEVAPVITTVARRIEVDLGDQRTYLYENESVVGSWAISSGLPGNDTDTGSFRITAKLTSQNMGNPDLTKAPYYYTKNVPWVMYYNGDEALHGAYWHNNFGNRMSHGCVNMPVDAAAFVYGWAPMGTEVWVHH